jgi:hypothetical protein
MPINCFAQLFRAQLPLLGLWDPVCEEDVEFMWLGSIAVGGPYDLFPIRREHGETIKIAIKGNLFRLGAIVSNHDPDGLAVWRDSKSK